MDKFEPKIPDFGTESQGELLGEVKAGFPSPAEDIREKLDLNKSRRKFTRSLCSSI